MRYRFKTEEEFKKDFGDIWRKYVPGGWVPSMDTLIGTSVPEEYSLQCQRGIGFNINNSYYITNSMYIEEENQFIKGTKVISNGLLLTSV